MSASFESRHPATKQIMRWFEYGHLPQHLQDISGPFWEFAHTMIRDLPDGPELTAGLRKLLEAKDCFVRAAVDAQPAPARSLKPVEDAA